MDARIVDIRLTTRVSLERTSISSCVCFPILVRGHRDASVERLAEIVTMRRQLCDEHVAAENQAAHLEDASSFDQLVGDGEHAWGHFDAESPRCLNVDDKLEVCRLQHWQIGGPYPVENAAGVDADLTTHVELVSSITHQPASCDIAPLRVCRWYPLACSQDRKLHTAAAEESVGTHEESIGTLACEQGERTIDLADGRGLEHLDLQSDDWGRFVEVPQCVLGSRRIGRIDEHGNASGLWN